MSTLTITHSPAEGTLLKGTSRGDGVNHILRSAPMQWRWSRTLGQFYAPHSRDRVVPNRHGIDATADALRAAGHAVELQLDGEDVRDVAEREQDRAERVANRVETLTDRSERRAREAAAARQARDQLTEHIPFGQPILRGHHSQRRAERDAERIHNLMGKAIAGDEASRHAADRADSAARVQENRATLSVTLRRIEKLEADERALERILDGHQRRFLDGSGDVLYVERNEPATGQRRADTTARLDDVRTQLQHWRAHVTTLQAQGEKVWCRADFAKGDWVLHRFGWSPVRRVNPKSLSVPNLHHPKLANDTIGYDRVVGRRAEADAADLIERFGADGYGPR